MYIKATHGIRLLSTLDEDKLIQALQSNTPAAFKQVVLAFQDRVYNTCLGFVHREAEAEDLAQEVFIEVYKSVSRFRKDSRLSTWIYRIAVSKSLEHIRRQKRQKRRAFFQAMMGGEADLTTVSDTIPHPGIQLENQERGKVLFQAIDQLPEKQKTAFTLNKVEGLSYQEISEIMNTSLSSVESLIFRARKNLQKKLRSYYQQDQK